MRFKIDRGIPIPEGRNFGRSKFPFKQMKLGDSFLIPIPRGKSGFSLVPYTYAAKLGMKITSTRDGSGQRVWRIK